MTRDRHPSGFHHAEGYCPSRRDGWYCNRTIKRDGLCGIHADAADRAATRKPRPTYAELRAERDALAAKVDRVRTLAEPWATQPTDYDEGTEQQIADAKTHLATLAADKDQR